ncbi:MULTISPECIES: LuxR C-terminal-related transcriptional regulator [Kribbella]|uniref:helix-turn-helix transcriptional regulator n=1 Tax=Kribbella TaxID=182639 RepID=UPI0010470786|nr:MULTISPECIES: LuxR C-terminal-related transcriptional regulator [Kribbella]
MAAGLERLGGASVHPVETRLVEALHTVAAVRPDATVVSPDLFGRPLGTVVAAFAHASTRSGLVIITADTCTLPARLDGMMRVVSGDYTMADLVAAVQATVQGVHTGVRRTLGAFDHLDGSIAARLTARERQVLECLVEGLDPAGIARRLSIRTSTARTHIKNLCRRLRVHSAAEAVNLVRNG